MVNRLLGVSYKPRPNFGLVENVALFRNLQIVFEGPCALACLEPTAMCVIPAPKTFSQLKMFDVLKRTV
jgi:hypothetical protein